jgi:hypothetical protein
MANALYDFGRQGFLDGSYSWSSNNIKVALCSAAYTRNLSTDEFLTSVSGILATSANLSSKTSTAGVANAASVTFSAVAGPTVGTQLVIYYDTGVAATSRLIGNIDTATGLPITPNGGDITVTWSTGANKIFKL